MPNLLWIDRRHFAVLRSRQGQWLELFVLSRQQLIALEGQPSM